MLFYFLTFRTIVNRSSQICLLSDYATVTWTGIFPCFGGQDGLIASIIPEEISLGISSSLVVYNYNIVFQRVK